MMPSAKQGKSNNPPPSPSKDSLDALSKLIEDKFTILEACIVSIEDQINKHEQFINMVKDIEQKANSALTLVFKNMRQPQQRESWDQTKQILATEILNVMSELNKDFRDVSRSVLITFNCYGCPKKLPNFSKSKYIIVFSVKMAEEINKEKLSLLKHTKSLRKSKFHCDILCCH